MLQIIILLSVISLVFLLKKISQKNKKLVNDSEIEMVKCRVCNLNTPARESIKKKEFWFCSQKCSSKNDT
tara:strand:- start:26253 stop:26462 length:210 start_codon:yes stop_codon:yes gene_type:complete